MQQNTILNKLSKTNFGCFKFDKNSYSFIYEENLCKSWIQDELVILIQYLDEELLSYSIEHNLIVKLNKNQLL